MRSLRRKSIKKLSETIEGIGKTGDSTKQIREIKSALESIKTPEIEISGIKEFAKQASAIAESFFKNCDQCKGNRCCVKRRESRTTHKKVKKRILHLLKIIVI